MTFWKLRGLLGTGSKGREVKGKEELLFVNKKKQKNFLNWAIA